MESFWNKKWGGLSNLVITGASSGIGREFLHLIEKLDDPPTICNLSRTKPEENFPSDRFHHFQTDLSTPDDLNQHFPTLLETIQNRPGKTLLIHNSGFGAYGTFPQPSADTHRAMIAINVTAIVDLTARLLPHLKEHGGAILNIASTAAFQPTPYMATYGATKAFLLHWGLALAEELRPYKITVTTICPGPTATPFFRRAGFREPVLNPKMVLDPKRVAIESLKAAAAGKRLHVVGLYNRLLTGLSSHLPKAIVGRISERILRRYKIEDTSTE